MMKNKSDSLLSAVIAPVSCKYGAPMGRADWITEPEGRHKFYLRPVKFQDDCYDKGGAYWGLPADLWVAYAQGEEELQRFFVRAESREEAWSQVTEAFPNSSLIRR